MGKEQERDMEEVWKGETKRKGKRREIDAKKGMHRRERKEKEAHTHHCPCKCRSCRLI